MKKIFAIFSSVLVALAASAFDITGNVVDEMGEPMPKATVRALSLPDSVAVKGDITTLEGQFKITGLKKGKYVLECTYVGYEPVKKAVAISGANVNAGTLAMNTTSQQLRDVEVMGIKTPIRVAEDTVEFNADSYKTQPNAMVEDLLKRLPGVEVDSDGKITHNGKEIKKILVDGQEFFADDPKVASKNLPVSMVEKLQVVDRKSDLARLTGVDDGDDETVINLTVKKGMKNAWFGSAEAGYGTNDRYRVNFNVNRFWNGNQVTILGGTNNVNSLDFTDGGSRFRRFGGANGITTSRSVGVNFNVGKEEVFRVGGNVLYSHSSSHNKTRQDRQYIFPDSASFYKSTKNAFDKTHNVRADFRMKWQPDSFNTLEFRPNFSGNFSDSNSDTESSTNAGHRGSDLIGDPVNANTSLQSSHGSSYEFGARLIYNHNFSQRRGRSFSVMANFTSSNQREKQNDYSRIQYFLLGSDTIYDQFANDHTWNQNFSTRVSWTEPLGDPTKGNYLNFSYRFSYRWNNADKMTYNRDIDLSPELLYLLETLPSDVLNDSLSNRFRNDYMNQDIRVGYRHVSATQRLDVGVSLVPQMSKSENLIDENKTIPERWVWNFAPYLRYRYKMSKTRTLQANYFGRSSQPSMSQLQPVADMSNPLNVVQGNPNLNPSFTHSLDARFQDFNQEAQRSMMFNLRAQVAQNSIVQRTTFDRETGGQFTTYENINGIWSLNAFTMVSFPLRNKHFTVNNHLGFNYNHNVGYSNGLRNNSGNLGLFESFGIAWRPDNVEIELRPNYRLQYVRNSVATNGNRTVHSYGGMFNATYYTPFGLILNTDLRYTANSGYGAGYNTNEWMWNAAISYQFLRDRSLVVKIAGYDLLQQRSSIRRNVSAAYIEDAKYNTLTRYFMASVSYTFNTFGKGKRPEVPGDFGPGRGPGGGFRQGPPRF